MAGRSGRPAKSAAQRSREYRERKKLRDLAAAAANVTSIDAARRPDGAGKAVPEADAPVAPEPGVVETEIRRALDGLEGGSALQRSLLAIAVSLARELDHPRGAGSVAGTAKQLRELVEEALKPVDPKGGGDASGLAGLAALIGSRG